ncbi:MAG: pyroglutamyl-peptidase I [Hyphomicrobiaceae bacterium]|nr:pyroglutamyl-peptidase I [Hyphomicrobiaceae bacterium]
MSRARDAAHARPTTVVLTGFGPFPGVPINATVRLVPEIAMALGKRRIDLSIITDILPVAWERGPARVRALIGEHRPDLVIHFGVSSAARGLVVERQAHNFCRTSADADGNLPSLNLIDADLGEAAVLPVSLPLDCVAAALDDMGIRFALSDDAGGYLCNAVLHASLREAAPDVAVGFLHVPADLGAADCPLAWEDAVEAGVAVVTACLTDGGARS